MPRIAAFPTIFPEGSFETIINFLRSNGTGDKWAATEAAYDLLGFWMAMMRQQFKSTMPRPVASAVPHDRAIVAELERFVAHIKNQQVVQQQAPEEDAENAQSEQPLSTIDVNLPDWFVAFLTQLLQRLLTT